jgi:hypothetical protein
VTPPELAPELAPVLASAPEVPCEPALAPELLVVPVVDDPPLPLDVWPPDDEVDVSEPGSELFPGSPLPPGSVPVLELPALQPANPAATTSDDSMANRETIALRFMTTPACSNQRLLTIGSTLLRCDPQSFDSDFPVRSPRNRIVQESR